MARFSFIFLVCIWFAFVYADDSPNKCGKNEVFYCGPSCPDSEASCSNPNPPTCFKTRCELKCFCKKSFVRGDYNACIPASKCPKQCTKPHERYSNCVLAECVPKTCGDLGKPLACPDIAPPCAGGCICEQGYVRNKDGNCINAKSCPSCGDDPNAESGCSNPCGKTCVNLRSNKSNERDTFAVQCARYCVMNGCDCKEGYILNTDVNPSRCVLPGDCNKNKLTATATRCSGANQKYECRSQYEWVRCEDRYNSPPINPGKHNQCRCYCNRNYWRNKKNECVKPEKCPQ